MTTEEGEPYFEPRTTPFLKISLALSIASALIVDRLEPSEAPTPPGIEETEAEDLNQSSDILFINGVAQDFDEDSRDDLGRVVTPVGLLSYGRDGHRVRCHKVGGSNPTSVLCAHLSCPLGS
jgi:hypothetical protein